MKIPIWIKSEYVTYIGIALLSFVRRGKPLLFCDGKCVESCMRAVSIAKIYAAFYILAFGERVDCYAAVLHSGGKVQIICITV